MFRDPRCKGHDDFNESDHPRDKIGQFTSGGGGGGISPGEAGIRAARQEGGNPYEGLTPGEAGIRAAQAETATRRAAFMRARRRWAEGE